MKRISSYLTIGTVLFVVLIVALIIVHHYQHQIDQTGKINNNINRVKKYVNKNPNNVEANLKLGTFYEHKGQYDKAVKHLKKVVQKNPKNLNGLIRLGNIYIEEGDFSNALKYREKALKEDPENPNLYVSLSQVELYFNVNQAAKDAHKALKMAKKSNGDKINYFIQYNQKIQALKKDIELDKPLKGYYQLLKSDAIYSKTYKLKLYNQALRKYSDDHGAYVKEFKTLKPRIKKQIKEFKTFQAKQ